MNRVTKELDPTENKGAHDEQEGPANTGRELNCQAIGERVKSLKIYWLSKTPPENKVRYIYALSLNQEEKKKE